jgi:hypothetical protein
VSGSGARQVSEGLLALGADTGLRLIAALGFVQTFLRGCATVLVVVVAIDLLGGGDADVGVLNAAIGLGALVGSLLASTITWNGRHARCLGVGVVLWGTPLTIVGGAPEAAAALLLFAAIGVGNALVDIGAYTLPARLAPDAVMARTFATLGALWTLGVAFGAAVTSPVIAPLGSRGALLALGVVGPAAVATAWPALRALDRRMARRDADIELLHQVALRRPLPQSTIEDLAASLSGSSSPRGDRSSRKAKRASRSTSSQRYTPSCCVATCRAPRRCEQPTTPSFMSACWPASASSPT